MSYDNVKHMPYADKMNQIKLWRSDVWVSDIKRCFATWNSQTNKDIINQFRLMGTENFNIVVWLELVLPQLSMWLLVWRCVNVFNTDIESDNLKVTSNRKNTLWVTEQHWTSNLATLIFDFESKWPYGFSSG